MVAFETWPSGHSALYKGQDAVNFIESHEASTTFAKLHVYEDDAEGEEAYETLTKEEVEDWVLRQEGKEVYCAGCGETTQAYSGHFVEGKGFYCGQCI